MEPPPLSILSYILYGQKYCICPIFFTILLSHYCCLNKNERTAIHPMISLCIIIMLLSLTPPPPLSTMSAAFYQNSWGFLSEQHQLAAKTLVLYFSYTWSHHRSSHLGYCGHYPLLWFQSIANWFCHQSHINLSQGRWKNCDIKSLPFLLNTLRIRAMICLTKYCTKSNIIRVFVP